ncbi:MAG TPA: thioredoxin domain-containing protein, partial [Nitrosopumilaceae archaeon]|nr:thioredoxin domain-containing protein [Nitrosopumilaceae archaeon]
MNRYYMVAIPAIITIAVLSYILYPHQNQDDAKVTSQTLMQNGSPILGNPDAPITIVEWGDYQCTYCHAF